MAPEPVWAPKMAGLRDLKAEERCKALLLLTDDLEGWRRLDSERSVAGPTTYIGYWMSESCSGRSGSEYSRVSGSVVRFGSAPFVKGRTLGESFFKSALAQSAGFLNTLRYSIYEREF